MKKTVILIFLIFSIGFAYAGNITLYNYTLQKNYSPNDLLKGSLNISISNAESTAEFNSSFGRFNLHDFLEDNGAYYACLPFDCEENYLKSNPATNKTVLLNQGEKKYLGFSIPNAALNSISFNISSDFPKSDFVPLKIKFFNDIEWEYEKFSTAYSDIRHYGCYGLGIADTLIQQAEYCEEITLPKSNAYILGALTNKADNKQLEMILYSDFSGSKLGSCFINPSQNIESCAVGESDGGIFEEQTYYVCVKSSSPTNYLLMSESSGENCGFVYPNAAFFKDYGVYARAQKYDNSGFSFTNIFEELKDSAQNYIDLKYNNNCTPECILPIEFLGIGQNLTASNIIVGYSNNINEPVIENRIYDLAVSPSRIDFKGILDIELGNLSVGAAGNKSFKLSLENAILINTFINVNAAPIINAITPTNPPAGIPVIFTASIDYNKLITKYLWKFGDGKTQETSSNNVTHIYENISSYELELTAYSGNLSTTKKFTIIAGSPKIALNFTLNYKKNLLNSVKNQINSFSLFYRDKARSLSQIEFLENELARLSARYNNAGEGDYLGIASELNNLIAPSKIYFSEQSTLPLIIDVNEINPSPVQVFAGGNEENLEAYKNPISKWQAEYITADVEEKTITLIKENGEKSSILYVYSIDLKSNYDDESYFIILAPFEEINFNDLTGRKAGDSTAIVINENEQKKIEFYTEEEAVFFVSPKLSSLQIEAPIGICNNNFICEEEENYKNCRHDCKPVGKMIFWIIIIILSGIVLYTFLQEWYKAKYEIFLFKDRRYLYNLLMFISNARARGMNNSQIEELLRNQKWSNEQIAYAIKKSEGKRTGMYELVPIEKLFAFFRNKKAKQNVGNPAFQRK